MRSFLLSVLGWSVIAVTVVDVFRTVLWSTEGAGPVTAVLTRAGRAALAGARRRHVRSVVGPFTLAAIVATWSLLMLVGFTLALEADPGAIRTAATDRPSDWIDRGYFVGFTLFTLGLGDFVPTTDATRAITVLINGAGMFLVTLSVTYLLPVISASVSSRAFGSSAHSLGATPEDVVTTAWNGRRVDLDHQLRDLATQLSTIAHQHLAYPVLHLFDSPDPTASAPLAVATLDDVLHLLDAIEPAAAPGLTSRRQLRSSIDRYVVTYGRGEATAPGPPPSLDALVDAGIPLIEDEPEFARRLADDAGRRARVEALARPTAASR